MSTNVYKFSLSMIRSFAVIIIWWFHPWRAPTGEESCVIIDILTHTWKKANLPQNRSRTFIFSRRHRHRTQPEIIIPTISEKKRKEGKKITHPSVSAFSATVLSFDVHPPIFPLLLSPLFNFNNWFRVKYFMAIKNSWREPSCGRFLNFSFVRWVECPEQRPFSSP